MPETNAARAQDDGWLGDERLRRNVVAYVWVRIAITTALLVVLAWQSGEGLNGLDLTYQELARLAAVSYAMWLISGIGLWLRLNPRALAMAQLCMDAVVVTELVVETRGVESLFGGLYIVSIVASAYLVNRTGTLITSFAAGGLIALVGVMGWGTQGILATSPGSVATQILVRIFAFLLVGVLSSRLSEELRATGRALERETARSTALQEEFSRVVGLLRSGLATVGPDGGLRSANPQALLFFPALATHPVAEVITGFSLDRRGVWEVSSGGATPRQVLVAVTPLDDGGCVVTLEDVSELRTMEREVQRQERLAAAGRFAAGVAHEVRNPLAALSSAVQMIEVNEQDRPLQDIILREVDRLDRLVTQFLETAEPPRPSSRRQTSPRSSRTSPPPSGVTAASPGGSAWPCRARCRSPSSRTRTSSGR